MLPLNFVQLCIYVVGEFKQVKNIKIQKFSKKATCLRVYTRRSLKFKKQTQVYFIISIRTNLFNFSFQHLVSTNKRSDFFNVSHKAVIEGSQRRFFFRPCWHQVRSHLKTIYGHSCYASFKSSPVKINLNLYLTPAFFGVFWKHLHVSNAKSFDNKF